MTPIEEIKQKLSIQDVVSSYLTLTKAGRNYKGVCPFHAEDTPSLMVSPELQIFKCFGCGKAGDIFKFVQEIEGIDFPETLKKLADKAGVELKQEQFDSQESKKRKRIFEINELVTELYHYLLTKHPSGRKGLEYCVNTRGLAKDIIENFRLGVSPDNWDFAYRYLQKKGFKDEEIIESGVGVRSKDGRKIIDKFRNRIMFPFIDADGKIVGFTARALKKDQEPKYLNTNDTMVFHKNLYVYALDKAKLSLKKSGAIFVEGQMDVITAHQFGIDNAVASSGTALTLGQLTIIKRYTEDLIFCFDSDTAGINAALRSISIAEKEGFNVKIAVIPNPYKDLDEYLRQDDNAVIDLKSKILPVYDFYLVAALKKHQKSDPIGKKKIVEELRPIYGTISNQVTQNHYLKLLSEELGLDQESVRSEILKKPDSSELQNQKFLEKKSENREISYKHEIQTPEEFFIAMMLNLDFDSQRDFLYKITPVDLQNEKAQNTLSELRNYLTNKQEFDIEEFIAIIDTNLRSFVQDLYLQDFGEYSTDDQKLFRDLNLAVNRIKRDSIKRELTLITEQVKLAEMEKNNVELSDLQNRLNELSKELLIYEKNY